MNGYIWHTSNVCMGKSLNCAALDCEVTNRKPPLYAGCLCRITGLPEIRPKEMRDNREEMKFEIKTLNQVLAIGGDLLTAEERTDILHRIKVNQRLIKISDNILELEAA